jgi:hypothetical protein
MTAPPDAGYSGTSLPQKIGIRPGHLVLLDGRPDDVDLGDLGAATVVRRLPRASRPLDVSLTWHTTLASLERRLPVLFERTATAGMVWVCWPKRSSGVASDLDGNVVRDLGLALGFVDVKVAAVDATWSGLKFVRRLKDR